MPNDLAGWLAAFGSFVTQANVGALALFVIGLGAAIRVIRAFRRG